HEELDPAQLVVQVLEVRRVGTRLSLTGHAGLPSRSAPGAGRARAPRPGARDSPRARARCRVAAVAGGRWWWTCRSRCESAAARRGIEGTEPWHRRTRAASAPTPGRTLPQAGRA